MDKPESGTTKDNIMTNAYLNKVLDRSTTSDYDKDEANYLLASLARGLMNERGAFIKDELEKWAGVFDWFENNIEDYYKRKERGMAYWQEHNQYLMWGVFTAWNNDDKEEAGRRSSQLDSADRERIPERTWKWINS